MTPARLGASLTCATPTPGKPNSATRTPHSIHIRNLMLRSLYYLRRDRAAAVRIFLLLAQRVGRQIGPVGIRDTPPPCRSPEMLERDHSRYKNYGIRLHADCGTHEASYPASAGQK